MNKSIKTTKLKRRKVRILDSLLLTLVMVMVIWLMSLLAFGKRKTFHKSIFLKLFRFPYPFLWLKDYMVVKVQESFQENQKFL